MFDQNVQLYDFIEARADSADCLQAAARVALVCGFAASLLQDARHCAIAVLYWARAASGTLSETQASYAAMKLSHSGTPIFSALAAAVLAGAVLVAGLLALLGAELLSFVGVSDLEHPTRTMAHTTQSNKVILVNM